MKTKKLLALIVACAMCLSLGACARNTTEASDPGYIMLDDFEVYVEDFAPIQMDAHFGIIDINKDPQYVYTGKASAKMQVNGVTISRPPTVRIPLVQYRKDLDESDMTDIGAVEAHFYNASDHDIDLVAYLSDANSVKLDQHSYVLKKGQWNTVIIRLNRTYDELMADLSNMAFVQYEFWQDADVKLAEVYLDTVKLHRETEAYTPLDLTVGADEIASFDSDWQMRLLQVYNTASLEYYAPKYSLVDTALTDEENGDLHKGRMLKTTFNGNAGGAAEGYAGYTIREAHVNATPIHQMTKEDSIALDVYNPQDEPVRLFFVILNAGGYRIMADEGIYLPARSWYTISFTGAQICQGSDAESGRKGDGGNIIDISRFNISWRYDFLKNMEYSLYFDNFRIVRAPAASTEG